MQARSATWGCPSATAGSRPKTFPVRASVDEDLLAIAPDLAKIARMSMPRVLATFVAGLFAFTTLSCSSPSSPKFALKASERRGRLESNGLRFVIMPDESTQLAEVDIRYDVGSREHLPR